MNIALGILNSFDFVNKDFSVAIGNLAVGDELPYFIIMCDYLRLGVLNCESFELLNFYNI